MVYLFDNNEIVHVFPHTIMLDQVPKKNRLASSKQSLTSTILDAILGDNIFVQIASMPYSGRKHVTSILSQEEWDDINTKRKEKKRISHLRKKKWIQDRQKGNKVVVRISEDALVSALRDQIKHSKTPLPDGKRCLVLFDFPNAATSARNSWRNLLVKAEFKKDQLSAWSTPFDVCHQLTALAKLLRISDWVKVYKVEPFE